MPSPASMPIAEATTPMISGLDHDRAEHLPPRGAQGSQGRELAGALGDGDGDGVEDDERADEQRDAAEHQQERAHAAEARGDLLGALLGLLIGGLELAVGGQKRRQPAGELGLRNALRSGHVDLVESPLLVEDGLRGREVEGGEGEGADRGPAELAGAGDREAPERPVGLRGDRVAHLVVVLLRRAGVDHDLVGTLGPGAR